MQSRKNKTILSFESQREFDNNCEVNQLITHQQMDQLADCWDSKNTDFLFFHKKTEKLLILFTWIDTSPLMVALEEKSPQSLESSVIQEKLEGNPSDGCRLDATRSEPYERWLSNL